MPQENLKIYKGLYLIETALREFIIESLETVAGPRWYKSRLPGDVYRKYHDGISYERSIRWSHLVPHHPIYYIDFPDLRKTIEGDANWRDAFQQVFRPKHVLVGVLAALEPIRNKVAHNRKATEADVSLVEAACSLLSGSLGEDKLVMLSSRCSSVPDLRAQLTHLRVESARLFQACTSLCHIEGSSVWHSVRGKWWFDESYLGFPLEDVRALFDAVEEYESLPRSRGLGHTTEQWIKGRDFGTLFQRSEAVFSSLLD